MILRFYTITFLFLVCACSKQESKNIEPSEPKFFIPTTDGIPREVSVFVIDSCEYIGYINRGPLDWATHKGNCRFCAERQRLYFLSLNNLRKKIEKLPL